MNHIVKLPLLFLLFAFIFLQGGTMLYAAPAEVTAVNVNITHREANMQVTGSIPKLQGMSNAIFMSKLNSSINKLYEEALANGQTSKLKNISFAYDMITSDNIVSVVLYKTEVSDVSTSTVNTFVFNKITNKTVLITDILGANGVKICNKVIGNTIARDTKKSYFDFKEIDPAQAFYVKNGNICIAFNEGVVASPSKGIITFEIPYNNVKSTIIGKGDYVNRTEYNLKMIPLRRVMGSLGYTLTYDSASARIQIVKGNTTAYVTLGSNIYKKGKLNKQLELQPETIKGVTYVPISFFTEIMNIYFNADNNGYITFSEYVENE